VSDGLRRLPGPRRPDRGIDIGRAGVSAADRPVRQRRGAQADPRRRRRACATLVGVLSQMRDYSTGKPKLRVRALAIVVALLLAGPLTMLVVRFFAAIVDALY